MGPNEKILRDGYARYVNGDIESVIGIFADDIVWTSVGSPSRIEMAGQWHGLDGVREYYAALATSWTLHEFDVVEVVAQDDRRFAVRICVRAESHVTGKSLRFEKVDLVAMARGKITNYAEIYDTGPLDRASRL